MNLEDMVCDLELAKKLKELGVKQESLYYWVDSTNTHERVFLSTNQTWGDEEKLYIYTAFTTDELLRFLPDNIVDIKNNNIYEFEMSIINNKYFVFYDRAEEVKCWSADYYKLFEDKKPSNALAKLLIWCIENNYVEAR